MEQGAMNLDPSRRYFHRPSLKVRGEWLVMSSAGTKQSERIEARFTSESDAARKVQEINRDLRHMKRRAA